MGSDGGWPTVIGKHLLADLYGVAVERLDDPTLLARCLADAARRCGMTPLAAPVMHRFPGGGVTGFILLAESHIALHTYPEHAYLALDVFSCGGSDPNDALEVFCKALEPEDVCARVAPRGERLPPSASILGIVPTARRATAGKPAG